MKRLQSGHAHFEKSYPLRIRCGVNEGLCVSNSNQNVSCLFTDGIYNCCQVIWHSPSATFCTHIKGYAPDPDGYILWALDKFWYRYEEPVTVCYVVSSEDDVTADIVFKALSTKVATTKLQRVKQCGGMVMYTNGNVKKTPPMGWTTNSPDVVVL